MARNPGLPGKPDQRVSSKPEGYLAGTGLICHLGRLTSPLAQEGHSPPGTLFETVMVPEIHEQDASLAGGSPLDH